MRVHYITLFVYFFRKKVESAARQTGELIQNYDVQLGGTGKLYGVVYVPTTCPHGTHNILIDYENTKLSFQRSQLNRLIIKYINIINILQYFPTVYSPCEYNSCGEERLCLPNARAGRSCVCPDGELDCQNLL